MKRLLTLLVGLLVFSGDAFSQFQPAPQYVGILSNNFRLVASDSATLEPLADARRRFARK